MSSLADRVRGIVKPSPVHGVGADLRVGPGGHTDPPSQDIERTLGGEWRDGCFVVERRLPPATRHGRETIGGMAQRLERSSPQATLFATGAPRPPFIFFDLETTGLSGGAGTQAFLVGCGRFEDDGTFTTRQFMQSRGADERTLLATVRAELARAGAIVSFNGKSFDAPLLETRYLFHRLEWARDDLAHVDVLHPARRFWGPDCSLIALEHRLLGRSRSGDVAGFEVPARYFRYVRTGDVQPLVAVLDHNRQDLLTLAALATRLLHLSHAGPADARDAAEALGLGRTYARAGHDDRAREAFQRAVAMSRGPAGAFDAVRIDSLRALALAWRRARRFDEAAQCWRQLAEIRGCPPHIAREAAEALAIHHEHRVGDLAAARQFALSSLEAEVPPAWTKAVQHRLARIDRKISERPLAFFSSSQS